jgi:serine/threonine protein phosphatase PrpC
MIKCISPSQSFLQKRSSPDRVSENLPRSQPRKLLKHNVKNLTIKIPDVPTIITKVQSSSNYTDFQKSTLEYALLSKKGDFRRQNEDRCLFSIVQGIQVFAVFDGYGGDEIAHLASEFLPNILQDTSDCYSLSDKIKKALRMLVNKLKLEKGSMLKTGTTVCVCLKLHQRVCIANIGDSGAFLMTKTGSIKKITKQHHLDNPNELKRIEEMGGVLLYGGGKIRLNGELTVTRSIGSYDLHPYLSDEPDIIEFDLSNDDSYIILGTDGIINYVGMEDKYIVNCPLELANNMHQVAIANGSKDNTSIVAIGH